jgi:hypothetical protein
VRSGQHLLAKKRGLSDKIEIPQAMDRATRRTERRVCAPGDPSSPESTISD